jgi:hypothetical protein
MVPIMETQYPLKIQAIRSKGQQPRYYVYLPLPLAAAIGMQAGEEVQWELLDRSELHLRRLRSPKPFATVTPKKKIRRQTTGGL